MMGWQEISYFFIALKQDGFIPVNWIVWKYYQGVGSKNRYTQRHEDILFFVKSKNYTFNVSDIRVEAKCNLPKKLKSGKTWCPPEKGKKNCEDVWLDITRINAVSKERVEHPTQKPLKLSTRIIKASSNPYDIILDPFIGSGTTAVASKKLGRQWIGIEISQKYCDIAVRRLKKVRFGEDLRSSDITKWLK